MARPPSEAEPTCLHSQLSSASHMEIRGRFCEVSSLYLPLCGFWELNLGLGTHAANPLATGTRRNQDVSCLSSGVDHSLLAPDPGLCTAVLSGNEQFPPTPRRRWVSGNGTSWAPVWAPYQEPLVLPTIRTGFPVWDEQKSRT